MLERGCGSRKDGGVYLCVAQSPLGLPIEDFILDPVKPWGGHPFRQPMLAERKLKSGSCMDAVIWVGAEFYPFVPDFIEEARIHGISKRVSTGFSFSKLTPGKSRVILIHPKALPLFPYEVQNIGKCKKEQKDILLSDVAYHKIMNNLCTYDLWPLSSLHSVDKLHEISEKDGMSFAQTPSIGYFTGEAISPPPGIYPYMAGAFAAFWISHFEVVSVKVDPTESVKKIADAGFEVLVVKE